MSAADAAAGETISREKLFDNLRAAWAMIGGCVWRTNDDHGRTNYLVTRGPMTRELPSLDAVEALLEEFTG